MKKYFVFFVILGIFFMSFVFSQEPFSVVGSSGMSFVDSGMQAQYDLMCSESEANCKDGVINLNIISNFFEDNASKSTFEINNNVRSIISSGGSLNKDLEIDSSGNVISGNFDIGSNSGDVSSFVSRDLDSGVVRVSNAEFEKVGSSSFIKFDKEGANVVINGSVFRNIKSVEGSNIELNDAGEIVSANFLVNENGGNYVFGGTEVFAPANSKIVFKDGVITMEVPEGSRISKFPEMKDFGFKDEKVLIVGKDVSLPNGHVLNSGVLNYQNGKLFVDSGNIAIIDNIELDSSGKYEIYFEDVRKPFVNDIEYKKNPSLYDTSFMRSLDSDSNGYLSIGKDSIIYSNIPAENFRGLELTFMDGSYFDSETSLYLNKNSYLRIDRNGWIENYPMIDSRDASFVLNTGELVFTQGADVSSEGLRKLSYSYVSSEIPSSEMTILSKDKIVSIATGKEFSVKYFRSSEDEPLTSDLVGRVMSSRAEIGADASGEMIHSFYEGSRALEISNDYSRYLQEAREILNVELERINPELFNSVKFMPRDEQLDFILNSGSNIAIFPERVNEILKDTKYKDYYKVLDSYRDFHVYYETVGTGESGVVLDEEAFGLRHAFYRYPAINN